MVTDNCYQTITFQNYTMFVLINNEDLQHWYYALIDRRGTRKILHMH